MYSIIKFKVKVHYTRTLHVYMICTCIMDFDSVFLPDNVVVQTCLCAAPCRLHYNYNKD